MELSLEACQEHREQASKRLAALLDVYAHISRVEARSSTMPSIKNSVVAEINTVIVDLWWLNRAIEDKQEAMGT